MSESNRSFAWKAAAVWGVLVFAATWTVRLRHPALSDVDPYYHLTVAEWIRDRGGYPEGLPWPRFSVWHDRWGDKEWLFHLFLIPFLWPDRLLGANTALSLINGAQAALLAGLGVGLVGRRGAWLPAVALAMSWHMAWRLNLLRPHTVSLMVHLLGAGFMAQRRWKALGLLCVVYPLAYTAWHTLPLMAVAVFFWTWVVRRERLWPLLAAPSAGSILGALVHPGFPDNLWIWKLQNIDFYRVAVAFHVGDEIQPLGLRLFLLDNSPAIGLALLGAALMTPWRRRIRLDYPMLVWGLFTAAFSFLYWKGERFSEYAVPFWGVMAMLLHDRWSTALPAPAGWRRRHAAILAAAVAVAAPINAVYAGIMTIRSDFLAFRNLGDGERFSNLLPEGAKVFSWWMDEPYYWYTAPQARYVNVLDPVFLLARDEGLFRLGDRLIASKEPDVAHIVRTRFDSDYIAFRPALNPHFAHRMEQDPRLENLGYFPPHLLFRIDPEGQRGFVVDWTLEGVDTDDYGEYARRRAPASEWPLEALERADRDLRAYVAAPAGLSPGACWWAYRRRDNPTPVSMSFSASGPSAIYIDGEKVRQTRGAEEAVIGYLRATFSYREAAIRTCPGRTGSGFFWRELPAD